MEQKQTLIMTASVITVMGLTACDNSNTAPRLPEDIAASYETLASTEEGTNSTLAGVALQTNDDNDTVELVRQTGTLNHATTEVTISDDIVTNETLDLVEDADNNFTGTYEYVRTYDIAYTSGGVAYQSAGVGGIVTRAGDVPTRGTATYTGEAEARIETITASNDDDFNYTNGTSTVEADFGEGTVDVTLGDFTARTGNDGIATASPIDTIKILNMNISGNAFSGGALVLLTDTQPDGSSTPVDTADVTGDNTTTNAAGNFFGYDGANSIPDEVGGVLYSTGDDGSVSADFIAD